MTLREIVSIPYSGTRFLRDRLGINSHIHTHKSWDSLLGCLQGKEIYAPLRSPRDVWRSWCRRRGFPSRHKGDPLMWTPVFFQCFFTMHALDLVLDIEFIPVDQHRHSKIEDWTPVGDKDADHKGWKLYKTDLDPILKLPFIRRHYGDLTQ